MKTTKTLKITSIINSIFCFFCIASTVCFAIVHYWKLMDFLRIAEYFVYGWAFLYPVTVISFIVCLVIWLVEGRFPDAKQVIRKKWLWIFIWPVITTSILLFTIPEIVWLTGGV